MKRSIILIFALSSVSCSSVATRDEYPPQYLPYALTMEQRNRLVDKALNGDGNASYALYTTALIVASDPAQAGFWLSLAAHQSHPAGMYAKGRELYYEESSVPQKRLGIWLIGRAARLGSTEANALLEKLQRTQVMPPETVAK